MNPNVVRAVEETADIVLVHNGEVCDARFSKCCGGITENFSSCWENIDVPYLLSFRDTDAAAEPFDASNEDAARRWIEGHNDAFCSSVDTRVLSQVLNGYDRETYDFYRWTVTYTANELSQLIKKKSGIDFGHIEELVPLQRGSSGRIIRLKIVGSEKSLVVGKELEIRRWLSTSHLYSSAFIVDKKLDTDGVVQFVLRGAGWGHGVGLCQIGAAAMSDKGYDFRAILSHYYPNTELKNINTL
jgi:SpoIID/LytB domain protein